MSALLRAEEKGGIAAYGLQKPSWLHPLEKQQPSSSFDQGVSVMCGVVVHSEIKLYDEKRFWEASENQIDGWLEKWVLFVS